VVRGSSFKDHTRQARCSARSGEAPDDSGLLDARYGFRVVMRV
jgi:formylglycine-generating enzyme required for sulfatase activity